MIIRAAMLADAYGIAQVHIASWQTTYAGLMPPEAIASRTLEDREAQWESSISRADPHQLILIAVDGTKIVGFIHAGPERSGDPHYTSEIYSFYLLKEVQGQGLGTVLLTQAFEFLQAHHKTALIWVLENNPAERFYAARGGRRDRIKTVEFAGYTFQDIGYGWEIETYTSEAGLGSSS